MAGGNDAERTVVRLQGIQVVEDLQTGVSGNVQVPVPPGISLPEEHVGVEAEDGVVEHRGCDGMEAAVLQQGCIERGGVAEERHPFPLGPTRAVAVDPVRRGLGFLLNHLHLPCRKQIAQNQEAELLEETDLVRIQHDCRFVLDNVADPGCGG